ncbi:hypothetical protein [Vibrio crassostreae]|uniref:hypothetical protein n=1 Tax=Vibrio crassostreae TaxID=246167 RepID=UPI001B3085B7|nr:hypothetical protein [Vibrio crassostreae]
MSNNLAVLKSKVEEMQKMGVKQIQFRHQTENSTHAVFSVEYLPTLVNWHVKYADLIEQFCDTKNQDTYINFLNDYFCAGDVIFAHKHKMPRDEAPYVMISVNLIKSHYSLMAVDNFLLLNLAEMPYHQDKEYQEHIPEIFKSVCPEAAIVKMDTLTEDNHHEVAMFFFDDEQFAYSFCKVYEDAELLDLKGLESATPNLIKIAHDEEIVEADAKAMAAVIKTAIEMGVFNMAKHKFEDHKELDVLSVCECCLKSYGMKKVSSNCCH